MLVRVFTIALLFFSGVSFVISQEMLLGEGCGDISSRVAYDIFKEKNNREPFEFEYEFSIFDLGGGKLCRLVKFKSLEGSESTNITLTVGEEKLFDRHLLGRCSGYENICNWVAYYQVELEGEVIPSEFELNYGGSNADKYRAKDSETQANVLPKGGTEVKTVISSLFFDEEGNVFGARVTITSGLQTKVTTPLPSVYPPVYILVQDVSISVSSRDNADRYKDIIAYAIMSSLNIPAYGESRVRYDDELGFYGTFRKVAEEAVGLEEGAGQFIALVDDRNFINVDLEKGTHAIYLDSPSSEDLGVWYRGINPRFPEISFSSPPDRFSTIQFIKEDEVSLERTVVDLQLFGEITLWFVVPTEEDR